MKQAKGDYERVSTKATTTQSRTQVSPRILTKLHAFMLTTVDRKKRNGFSTSNTGAEAFSSAVVLLYPLYHRSTHSLMTGYNAIRLERIMLRKFPVTSFRASLRIDNAIPRLLVLPPDTFLKYHQRHFHLLAILVTKSPIHDLVDSTPAPFYTGSINNVIRSSSTPPPSTTLSRSSSIRLCKRSRYQGFSIHLFAMVDTRASLPPPPCSQYLRRPSLHDNEIKRTR